MAWNSMQEMLWTSCYEHPAMHTVEMDHVLLHQRCWGQPHGRQALINHHHVTTLHGDFNHGYVNPKNVSLSSWLGGNKIPVVLRHFIQSHHTRQYFNPICDHPICDPFSCLIMYCPAYHSLGEIQRKSEPFHRISSLPPAMAHWSMVCSCSREERRW